jgi:hypothetical protein
MKISIGQKSVSKEDSSNEFNVRISRTREEIKELRLIWKEWQRDRNVDFNFYFCVIDSSRGTLQPHVILLIKNGIPQAMLVGRIERQRITSRLGYMTIFSSEATVLAIIYGGILGDVASNNARILFRELMNCLKRVEAFEPLSARLMMTYM